MANTPLGRLWLALPWCILALGLPLIAWWLLEPVPVQVSYVSPAFLSRPAMTRDDARGLHLTEVRGGSTVWRYVEYCVTKSFEATVHRAWVGKALVWHAPDLPTMLSREIGCGAANLAVEVPTSSPSRSFYFVQRMEIALNPLRTAVIEYAPIPLTILDGKGQ